MGGGVSAAILRAGGREIMLDAAKKVPAKLGDVVVTTAGSLPAQYIFHAISIGSQNEAAGAKEVLHRTVTRCLDLLEALNLDSLAFPAIGAGVAGFDYKDVAVEMANVIAGRLTKATKSLQISIFLFDRFGRMEPLDFIMFFEEFASKVPSVAAHEVRVPVAITPSSGPKLTDLPDRQQGLRLRLMDLRDKQNRLEEQMVASGIHEGPGINELRARLAEIQNDRLDILAELKQAELERSASRPVEVFISYAHADEVLRNQLGKHLSILQREGIISAWHDRIITAGSEWKGEIDQHLESASLILLLISSDFVDSDYCWDVEMTRAMQRQKLREARVIPVILRPVMWQKTPFAKLQALPPEGCAVTTWANQDAAFLSVAEGIRTAAEEILAEPTS